MSPASTDQRGIASLQARVTSILMRPQQEWQVIAAEPTDIASLYANYIAVLAAIPAVCLFLGFALFGVPFTGLGFGTGLALQAGISLYVRTLVGTYVAAVVIEKLAPTFGSRPSTAQALKLVAYSYTPVWIAGVLYLFLPLAGLVALAALYAIYLFYLGLKPTMGTPDDKVIPYMLVSAIVVACVTVVLRVLAAAIVGVPRDGMF